MNSPNLVETGTKYFLRETLKQCNTTKKLYYNNLMNASLFILFCGGLAWFLYYKYNQKKIDIIQAPEKELNTQVQLATLIQKVNQDHYREKGHLITDLPTFENAFENTMTTVQKQQPQPQTQPYMNTQYPPHLQKLIMPTTLEPQNMNSVDYQNQVYLENHSQKVNFI